MECEKCFKELHECQACHGRPRNNCRTCQSTGMICPTHEGFWKR
jgi:hypothetical protein